MRKTVEAAGLREYYDPYTGRGMGAEHFSWSPLIVEMTTRRCPLVLFSFV